MSSGRNGNRLATGARWRGRFEAFEFGEEVEHGFHVNVAGLVFGGFEGAGVEQEGEGLAERGDLADIGIVDTITATSSWRLLDDDDEATGPPDGLPVGAVGDRPT